VTAFAEMMTARTGSRDLEAWLAAVEADDQAGLRSLAIGIRNDQQAVTNGPTLHWNSGRVEGTVNKIKMIKRQMYGRAGFDLLRKRVILHPALPDHKIRGRAGNSLPPRSAFSLGRAGRARRGFAPGPSS
jgi:Transposase